MFALDINLIKLTHRSKEDIHCDVGKDVFEPSETRNENEDIECNSWNQCSWFKNVHQILISLVKMEPNN